MKYLEQIEAEFIAELRASKSDARLARWVSEKVLASYRNGIKAGQNGAQVKRDGKSRRALPPVV
jgi:hypothetical protein